MGTGGEGRRLQRQETDGYDDCKPNAPYVTLLGNAAFEQ